MLPREKERVVLTCWEHFELRKKYGAKDERQCEDCFHCQFFPGSETLRECALARSFQGKRDHVLWDPLWPACGRFVQRMVQGWLF